MLLVIGLEAMILTSTSLTSISLVMSRIFPNRAPFEHIELLRQFFIASSCIATQLSGILYPVPEEASKNRSVETVIEPMFGLVEQLHEYSSLANVELIKLMFNDLHPIIRTPADEKTADKSEDADPVADASSLSQSQNLEVQKVISEVKSKMLDVSAFFFLPAPVRI
jgi:hypothetical protein